MQFRNGWSRLGGKDKVLTWRNGLSVDTQTEVYYILYDGLIPFSRHLFDCRAGYLVWTYPQV